jgi:hypothetical protein
MSGLTVGPSSAASPLHAPERAGCLWLHPAEESAYPPPPPPPLLLELLPLCPRALLPPSSPRKDLHAHTRSEGPTGKATPLRSESFTSSLPPAPWRTVSVPVGWPRCVTARGEHNRTVQSTSGCSRSWAASGPCTAPTLACPIWPAAVISSAMLPAYRSAACTENNDGLYMGVVGRQYVEATETVWAAPGPHGHATQVCSFSVPGAMQGLRCCRSVRIVQDCPCHACRVLCCLTSSHGIPSLQHQHAARAVRCST